MRSRLRPTLLLQTVAALVSILALVAGGLVLVRVPNWWLLAGLVVLWLVGLELYVLPAILEWWAVRRAEKQGGLLRSAWFTYAADEAEAAERERQRRDVQDNPSLW